jgi:hypothetical protein
MRTVEIVLAIVAALSLLGGFALAFGHSSAAGAAGLISQARKGVRLRVVGRVVADKPLTSPVSNTPCAYWHLEIASTSNQTLRLEDALAGERLRKRDSTSTDRTSAWADGLRVEDATGAILLDPIGGQIETTRGTKLTQGFMKNERVTEIVRAHGSAGVEADVSSVQERLLELGTNVVVEGVVEDIKGRLFLGGEGAFRLEPQQAAAAPSPSTLLLGRGLLGLGGVSLLALLLMRVLAD